MPLESDDGIRTLLRGVRSVAVVGIKDDPGEDAHRVPAYLQSRGLRILPINPKLHRVLGEDAVASLAGLREPPDVVNLFRAAEHLPGHLAEILALDPRPRCVWLQLGIRNEDFVRRLEDAGITVVQDRCLMVDYARLMAEPPSGSV